MSIPATKLKERFGDSRKRRPNKLETKPSRLHRTLTLSFTGPLVSQTVEKSLIWIKPFSTERAEFHLVISKERIVPLMKWGSKPCIPWKALPGRTNTGRSD